MPAQPAAGAAAGAGDAATGGASSAAAPAAGEGAAPAGGIPVAVKVIESAEINAFLKEAGILEHLNGSPQVRSVECGLAMGRDAGAGSWSACCQHSQRRSVPPVTLQTCRWCRCWVPA